MLKDEMNARIAALEEALVQSKSNHESLMQALNQSQANHNALMGRLEEAKHMLEMVEKPEAANSESA